MLNIQVVVTASLPPQPLTPGQIASMKSQISALPFAEDLTRNGHAILNLEIPEETEPREYLKAAIKKLPDHMSPDDLLTLPEVSAYLQSCDQTEKSLLKSSMRSLRRGNITVLGTARVATRQQLFRLRNFGQKRVNFTCWLFDLN